MIGEKTKQRLVLVVDQTVARIFSYEGPPSELRLLKALSSVDGRKKEQELVTDAPGTALDSVGPHRSAYEPRHSHKEMVAQRFHHQVTGELERLCHNQVSELTVIAPPKVLGAIRPAIDDIKTVSVVSEIHKDLSEKDASEITEYIKTAANSAS